MIRTYLDSGVLMLAFGGRKSTQKAIAGRILYDPDREFLSGPLVEMETVLHARRERDRDRAEAYEDYIRESKWFGDLDRIFEIARNEILRTALSVSDACHIATAYLLGADEFITTEKVSKPVHRNTLVHTVSIAE